ncbi:hypothetical protein D3C78_1220780 [compost metagenome]
MRASSTMKVRCQRMLLANSCSPTRYFPDALAIFLHEYSNIKRFTLCTVEVQIGLKQKWTISYKFMNPDESFFQGKELSLKCMVPVISSNQSQAFLWRRHLNKQRSFPVCSVLWFHKHLAFMSEQPLGKLIGSGIFACFWQIRSNIRVFH